MESEPTVLGILLILCCTVSLSLPSASLTKQHVFSAVPIDTSCPISNPNRTGDSGHFLAGSLVLIPSMNFCSDGNTSSLKWILLHPPRSSNNIAPRIDLQIWRLKGNVSATLEFMRVYNEMLTIYDSEASTRAYTVTPAVSNSFLYKSGDIVGFYLPLWTGSTGPVDLPFNTVSVHSYAYFSITQNTTIANEVTVTPKYNSSDGYLRTGAPHLNVVSLSSDYSPMATPWPTSTLAPTSRSTPTSTLATTDSTNTLDVGPMVGGIVGSIVLVGIGVIVLIILCVWWRRRNRKINNIQENHISSYYSAESTVAEESPHTLIKSNIYEQPKGYPHPLTTPTLSQEHNNVAAPYEEPVSSLGKSAPTLPPPMATYETCGNVLENSGRCRIVTEGMSGQVNRKREVDEEEYHKFDKQNGMQRKTGSDTMTTKFPIYGYVPTMEERRKMATLSSSTYYEDGNNFRPVTKLSSLNLSEFRIGAGAMDSVCEVERSMQSSIYIAPSSTEEEIYAQLAQYCILEIPSHHITTGNKLGEGQFGEVYRASWRSPKSGLTDVAVKLVREGVPVEQKLKLLQEAVIIGQFKHRHVVQLYGVVTLEQPNMIIMELLPKGDLLNYLNMTKRTPSLLKDPSLPSLLLQFCKQVIDGLAFLAKKLFVHRDIAARNILLDCELNCKIADFGMSRNLEDSEYYVTHGGHIPVKWTAPEAILYRKYSTASDVWSYGMLMYEIWSLGHKPFENHAINEVVQIFDKGYCHPCPPGCPRAVYQVMVQCWNPDSHKRPTANDISGQFCKSERFLLSRNEEENSSKWAGVLGAPLTEGKHLFEDLQFKYTNNKEQ